MPIAEPFELDGKLCCRVPLTQGYEALVDADLYPEIRKKRWKACRIGKIVYALSKNTMMHQMVIELTIGRKLTYADKVDHSRGGELDNRLSNLRQATNKDNVRNSRLKVTNTSGYKGVSWNKNERKWLSNILVSGHLIRLYGGSCKITAAHAYDDGARKHFGEFACVNFPREGERGARLTCDGSSS